VFLDFLLAAARVSPHQPITIQRGTWESVFFPATEGKCSDPTNLTSSMIIMDDSDNEFASSRLSETSEDDSVSSKENDPMAKAAKLSFSSPLGPHIVK